MDTLLAAMSRCKMRSLCDTPFEVDSDEAKDNHDGHDKLHAGTFADNDTMPRICIDPETTSSLKSEMAQGAESDMDLC